MSFRTNCNLFADRWEYLDFKRSRDSAISRPCGNEEFTATLKKEGSSTFFYRLTHRGGAEIVSDFQRFRATDSRLFQFHIGCARVERDLRRHLRSGDTKWLRPKRPFGPLHGGILLENGCTMWRGDTDDIDRDEWIDSVQDESLARLLCRVDQLTSVEMEDAERELRRQQAWEMLEALPAIHGNHVEVLRRRLQSACPPGDSFPDPEQAARWARSLVEAEPHEVINWWSLTSAMQSLGGHSAAVEVLREGIRRHGPDFTLSYDLSSHLCALGEIGEAKEAMLEALKQEPFSLEDALHSECYAPIRDFIREQARSEWYQNERKRWGIPDPLREAPVD